MTGLKTVTHLKGYRLPSVLIFGFVSLILSNSVVLSLSCPLISGSTFLHGQHCLSDANVGSISDV